jgi:hypothetical protein
MRKRRWCRADAPAARKEFDIEQRFVCCTAEKLPPLHSTRIDAMRDWVLWTIEQHGGTILAPLKETLLSSEPASDRHAVSRISRNY